MRVWPSEGEDKAWPKLDSKTNSQIWAPGLPPPSLDLKCSQFSQILELIYCLDFLHFLLLRSVRISEHMLVVFLWIDMGKSWFSSVYHQVNTFLLYVHSHPPDLYPDSCNFDWFDLRSDKTCVADGRAQHRGDGRPSRPADRAPLLDLAVNLGPNNSLKNVPI